MGKRAVAVSLGLTYCVVTIAWCFALVKMVALASSGIPALAHSIIEQAEVVISGRPVLASSIANGHAARPESMDCDPTEPSGCVLLPSYDGPVAQSARRAASSRRTKVSTPPSANPAWIAPMPNG